MKAFGKNKAVVLLGVVSALMIGCGKDKTAEQYQRQQLQESLEVYESVAGKYTGMVENVENGRPMGALELELRAETQPVNPNGGDISVGAPLLRTNVRFRDQTVLNFTIASSYYNEDTGGYSATAVYTYGTPGNQIEERVMINGTIRDSRIYGTIGAVNSPTGTGRFELRLNGDSLDKIRKGAPKGPLDRALLVREFKGYEVRNGKKVDRDGLTKRMVLTVEQPTTGSGVGDFVNLFYPESRKALAVTLNFSDRISMSFQNVIFDPQNGTLEGTTTTGTGPVWLQCQSFYFAAQDDQFGCYYRSSNPVPPFNFIFNP